MNENRQHAGTRMGSTTYTMICIALFAVLIAICSWITIPFAVPFTLQTFAVFSALLLLGGKWGTVSVAIYILLGVIGLPVFSGFSGGVGQLLGPTGGYIVGFLATGLIYWLSSKLFGQKLYVKIISLVVGLIGCYALGTIWFVHVYSSEFSPIGFGAALSMCVFPFILPDLCKLACAVLLSRKLGFLTLDRMNRNS